MSSLLGRVSKLRGRSFDELRTRGRQALASALERHGLSPTLGCPGAPLHELLAEGVDAGSLRARFRARETPRFFAGLDDRRATIAALRQLAPDAEHRVIARARRAAEGRFSFLGQHDLSFGDPIDWWLDPVSGRRAPGVHWSQIAYLDPQVAGDHKIVWELNRHQHFVTLGQAYWYTGDEAFATAFVTQLSSWLDANPPKLGINWASSLEVALRSISWLWALHLFGESPALTSTLVERAIASLQVHGRHLETYLSTYFSPNTHLTGEALGLYYLGAALPELRAAIRWRALGSEILSAQMVRQVRPDGIYFEQATCYQRYTADFCLHHELLAERQDTEPAASQRRITTVLTSLLDGLTMLRRPDGSLPLLGDDDGGQLLLLDDRAVCDVRATLGVGAALFGRADYRHGAGDLGAAPVWLLGPARAEEMFGAPARPPSVLSHAFRDGGWYVMRDSWSSDANYLVVDCGPHGAVGCGHAHADVLACEVVSHGSPMLVDPGTFTYTADSAARDRFRRTESHNALVLDGVSSSEPQAPFRWLRMAIARLERWTSSERLDFFAGEHDGYRHLPGAPVVRRSILFIRGDYWVMRDEVESTDAHWIQIGYQCAAGVQVARCDERRVELRAADGAGLLLAVVSGAGRFAVTEGMVSASYGALANSPRVEFTMQAAAGADIVTVMIPLAAHASGLTVEEDSDRVTPAAFTIGGELYSDTVSIGCSHTSPGAIVSDGDWTWVRRAGAGGPVRELAIISGRRAALDSVELFDFTERGGAADVAVCLDSRTALHSAHGLASPLVRAGD